MIQEPVWKTMSAESLRRAPLLGILVAFLLVAGVCVLGLWNDLTNRSKLLLSSEISNLQSHVERTIVRIETDLNDGKSLDHFTSPLVAPWLTDHWNRMIVSQSNRLYASVEDSGGQLRSFAGRINLLEERPTRTEQVPGFPGYVHRVFYGDTKDPHAIEISLPITHNDRRVGTYRTAIPSDWLEGNMDSMARSRWLVWIAILAAMTAIVSTTALFLFRLGAHTRDLEQALKTSETRRLADLSKLVVSMAHELRNPLNSIRLNLFTSEKLIRGESPMDQEEALVMIHESVSEIERVNELIGQLLGFVKADDSQDVWLNIDAEVQSLLQFLKPTHEYHAIEIDYFSTEENPIGKISKKYFRQILINLLQNARQALPKGGKVRMELCADQQWVSLRIEDSGPGVSPSMFDKIFEPFFSTHKDGAGLGLAVVKNLMEACGGNVSCRHSSTLGGLRFDLRFQAKPWVLNEVSPNNTFATPSRMVEVSTAQQ